MSKTATLEMISIGQIDISKTNPRKSFDEKALKELSESIKAHGILQPVLVRPIEKENTDSEQFELVCGERRLRAAKLAGIEDIPVNIRVLTDDEAFELQIIENLERKDVHPLDEADAFKKMIDSGKYTIEDVAAKMAKSESFIAQRLKLVDLIDDVRKDFLAGYLGIGHAIQIAKADEEKQKSIYNDAKPWNEDGEPDYGTISKLKEELIDDTNDLTKAPFDLTDATLVSSCGACEVCPKRSKANPLLFKDIQEDVCFDEVCYNKKVEAFTELEVSKIINDGLDIKFVAYGKPSDMIVHMCKEFNIHIFKDYSDSHTWETKDTVPAKGFYVSGGSIGEYKDVFISKDKLKIDDSDSTNSTQELSNEVNEQIAKIEQRADRAKELDGEKVWAKIREIDTSEIKTIIGGLFEVEVDAVCLAMISKLGYYGNQEVKKLVGEFTLKTLEERNFTKFEFNQICRIFFLECLPNGYGDYYSNLNNYAYTKALIHYKGEEIQKFIDEQKAISDIRMDKTDAKIKALKSKLEVENIGTTQEVEFEETEGIIDPAVDVPTFDKITRKKLFSLNNSYFKNCNPQTEPSTPLQVMQYFNQHGELPFDMGSDTENWLYECYVEYQKRAGVYGSQYFTPPATAKRMAELANDYFNYEDGVPYVLDACCGFGMLTKELKKEGFIVSGFDNNIQLLELYGNYTECLSEHADFMNDHIDLSYRNVISNPPYETPALTKLLEVLYNILLEDGTAILLLPNGFVNKDKPKALVQVLEKFDVIHQEYMDEDFARTKISAEIVVLKKL